MKDKTDRPEFTDDLQKPEPEKPSGFKKIFLGLFTILVILMLVFYFLSNPVTQNTIIGLFESSTISNSSLDLGVGNRLFFENSTYERLMAIYDNNAEKEFKACLLGSIEKGDYYINSIFEPRMAYQSPNEVIAEPCPDETLVSLHSHPFRQCLPSEVDLKNFELLKKLNNKTLMAVMCERGRFNFYR